MLGDFPRAILALERALQHAPPRSDIYAELLKLYIARGQYDKADALYHRALTALPGEVRLDSLHGEIAH